MQNEVKKGIAKAELICPRLAKALAVHAGTDCQ
jgi:hypothetical protein